MNNLNSNLPTLCCYRLEWGSLRKNRGWRSRLQAAPSTKLSPCCSAQLHQQRRLQQGQKQKQRLQLTSWTLTAIHPLPFLPLQQLLFLTVCRHLQPTLQQHRSIVCRKTIPHRQMSRRLLCHVQQEQQRLRLNSYKAASLQPRWTVWLRPWSRKAVRKPVCISKPTSLNVDRATLSWG